MNPDYIPVYAADGSSLGVRAFATAERLVAEGFVKASYGRKGHLKAIWLLQEDGASPVEGSARMGTRYSFQEGLGHGRRCWKLKNVDARGESGEPVGTRAAFFQVVVDCGAEPSVPAVVRFAKEKVTG